MANKVVLIGCSSLKLSIPAKAIEFYQGELFKRQLAYARKLGGAIFILSAFYGLVECEQILEPYNATMKYIPPKQRKRGLLILSESQKQGWRNQVLSELSKRCSLENDEFVFLCGKDYYLLLTPFIKNWTAPLTHLTNGL